MVMPLLLHPEVDHFLLDMDAPDDHMDYHCPEGCLPGLGLGRDQFVLHKYKTCVKKGAENFETFLNSVTVRDLALQWDWRLQYLPSDEQEEEEKEEGNSDQEHGEKDGDGKEDQEEGREEEEDSEEGRKDEEREEEEEGKKDDEGGEEGEKDEGEDKEHKEEEDKRKGDKQETVTEDTETAEEEIEDKEEDQTKPAGSCLVPLKPLSLQDIQVFSKRNYLEALIG